MKAIAGAVLLVFMFAQVAGPASATPPDAARRADVNAAKVVTKPLSVGDSLPEKYRQDDYTVYDWEAHHLKAPPQGERWARGDRNQFVRFNVVTGLVLEIVQPSYGAMRNRVMLTPISQAVAPTRPFPPAPEGGQGAWATGDHMTISEQSVCAVVTDWQTVHLTKPGRGEHWLLCKALYVLVQRTQGLVRAARSVTP